jgi:hypothetical protein
MSNQCVQFKGRPLPCTLVCDARARVLRCARPTCSSSTQGCWAPADCRSAARSSHHTPGAAAHLMLHQRGSQVTGWPWRWPHACARAVPTAVARVPVDTRSCFCALAACRCCLRPACRLSRLPVPLRHSSAV